MASPKIIMVHLRRPRLSDPGEKRSDPFWEFGSFGCTRCHRRNLMNPRKINELAGARLAFAQGGPQGFRLVFLSPPVTVHRHRNCCELRWKPARMPFRYAAAPLLVDNEGESDFPALLALLIPVNRPTLTASFSSRFRSCRKPLPTGMARSLVRRYEHAVRRASKAELATRYDQALPYPPPQVDTHRRRTYQDLLAKARGATRCEACTTRAGPQPRGKAWDRHQCR